MIFRFLIILLLIWSPKLLAQPCTNPGQTPSTAFPVCGTSTFQQSNVPICGSNTLVVPNCPGSGTLKYSDKNPYWYKFTCFTAGTLGFLIKPNNANDDYDWQLYDITGRNPNDVFTDPSLVVTGNWAGTLGNTGASASGVNFIQCASNPSDNLNSFSAMPTLIVGHTYLLLVSHFTDSQSGYSLSFGGGTAVITDPTLPGLSFAESGCNGNTVRVKLKKKIKCSTLTGSGSEFTINAPGVTITSATGWGCGSGFDTDSIILTLSAGLPQGNYTLGIKNGTDGNTLLDNCDNAISNSETTAFSVLPNVPTPMDSLTKPGCAPKTLRLVFSKPILCSSVASNGSDFTVSGTYPVTISGAQASCSTGTTLSKEIIITLSQPLYNAGNFTLTLKAGTDGNTILDECSRETLAGSFLTFNLQDTVNADFSFIKRYGCTRDTIFLFHPGAGVSNWSWNLDDGMNSSVQNPVAVYSQFDTKNISLVVSNGFCSDSATASIALTNFLKASFDVIEDNCPNEEIKFTSTAQGIITNHSWNFGDGGTSLLASPLHTYSQPSAVTSFLVNYTVTDSIGCTSTAQKKLMIYSSCLVAVPNAFTPNNDGKNDFLRVLNAVKATDLRFLVYNRWGQLMFETKDWKQGWDGKFKGLKQGSETYVWYLQYKIRDTGEARQMKGTATLIR